MGRMVNPPHPGECLQDSLHDAGWTVSEAARRLGVARITLSRLLHGHTGVSAEMALALERIGWSNAEFWLRLQANYDLARARRKAAA